MHTFSTKQFLPINIEEAWQFFSKPVNLARITPPELDFKIISEVPQSDIYDGLTINYIVKPLFGVPVRWKTVLKDIIKNKEFTDIQVEGPYTVWIHKHTFVEWENGVMMYDEVKYKIPFGIIGELLNLIFIRQKIGKIFNYRKQVLIKLFSHGIAV